MRTREETENRSVLLRLLLVVVVVGVSLIVLREPTQACECEEIHGPYTATDELEDSLLVFRGVVTSIEIQGEESWAEVGFSVVTVWKGPAAAEITVWSYAIRGVCCYEFEEGVEYLVYTSDSGYVSSCSRTGLVADAQEDIEALGSGFIPDGDRHPPVRYVPEWLTPPPPPTDRTWIYVGIGFAVLGSVLGVARLYQHRNKLKRGAG